MFGWVDFYLRKQFCFKNDPMIPIPEWEENQEDKPPLFSVAERKSGLNKYTLCVINIHWIYLYMQLHIRNDIMQANGLHSHPATWFYVLPKLKAFGKNCSGWPMRSAEIFLTLFHRFAGRGPGGGIFLVVWFMPCNLHFQTYHIASHYTSVNESTLKVLHRSAFCQWPISSFIN